MDFPYGITVTLIKRSVTNDAYGDETAPQTTEVIDNVAFAPGQSNESTEPGRFQVVTGYTLLLPTYRTDIDPDDQFEIDGKLYKIVGYPAPWSHPMVDWQPGTQVTLERVEG